MRGCSINPNDKDVERNFLKSDGTYDTSNFDFIGKPTKSRSIRRAWNQLSRLQRFIICMLIFFFVLCIIVLLPWTDSSFSNSVHSKSNKNAPRIKIDFTRDRQYVKSTLSSTNVKKDNIPYLQIEKFNFDVPGNNLINKIIGASKTERSSTLEKQNAVVSAFLHAWKGYRSYAWGHDQLKPITKSFHNWFGLGLSIVDSLDTMYMMGLQAEFTEAKEWVKERLNFNINKDVNFFETTIRVLGGLLSAFHLTKDTLFLDKAIDLADRLLPGFRSASGVPFSDVNLQTGHAHPPSWGQDSTVSETSTVQLEFRDVSRITGNSKYEEESFKVSKHLHGLPKKDGLVPMFINAESGQFRSTSTITIGARADSYYEYLLKQWIQTGRKIDWLKDDYIEAIDGIMKHLVKHSYPNKFTFIGELLSGRSYSPKMDHLVCYLPGTLALGHHYGMPPSHLKLAVDLMDTCYNMYAKTATFLSPEITYFNIQPHGTNDIIIYH